MTEASERAGRVLEERLGYALCRSNVVVSYAVEMVRRGDIETEAALILLVKILALTADRAEHRLLLSLERTVVAVDPRWYLPAASPLPEKPKPKTTIERAEEALNIMQAECEKHGVKIDTHSIDATREAILKRTEPKRSG